MILGSYDDVNRHLCGYVIGIQVMRSPRSNRTLVDIVRSQIMTNRAVTLIEQYFYVIDLSSDYTFVWLDADVNM